MVTAIVRRRAGHGLYPARPGMQQNSGAKRRKLPEHLSHDEVLTMLRAADGPQARLLMLIMFRAGLRVSEALGVTRADVRVTDGQPVLHVRQGKGSKPRMVPLHPDLIAAFDTALGYLPKGDGPIIPAHRATAWRWVKAAQAQATAAGELHEGREVGDHTFRHSAARHWLANGVPINVVSRWLGHAPIQTTLIYLDVLPDQLGMMRRIP